MSRIRENFSEEEITSLEDMIKELSTNLWIKKGYDMGIRIITDTTSDISMEQANEMNITLVPLKVIFGDKEYKGELT